MFERRGAREDRRVGDERAMSEVIGFTLVVSLILATIGVVYVAGFGGLQDARGAERVNNAERAFDVLADNLADIYREDAPSRATEIKLADSQLAYGRPTTVSVAFTNYSGTGTPTFGTTLDPIVYTTSREETRLLYEAGAVIREERDGAVFQQAPPFVFARDVPTRTVVFQLVQTRATGSGSIGGDTTVLVRSDHVVSDSLNASTDPVADTAGSAYEVNVTVETTEGRAPAWERRLNASVPSSFAASADPCTRSAGTVTCTVVAERVYVSVARIDVQFS